MKPIVLSDHARDRLVWRGTSEAEVVETIQTGQKEPAKKGRHGYRKNFPYHGSWSGRFYATKQVLAIVVDEPDALVVVTIYTFYF